MKRVKFLPEDFDELERRVQAQIRVIVDHLGRPLQPLEIHNHQERLRKVFKRAMSFELADQRQQVTCGAKTRQGRPCKRMSVPGKRRCPNHGGWSTGPKTAAGRERIREAQARRWVRYWGYPC